VQRFVTRDYPSLEAIVTDFLQDEPVAAACFGLAGPVLGSVGRVTNLDWRVDRDDLEQALGGCPVLLLNDLESMAHGVPTLGPEQLLTLNAGRKRPGHAAVIAAGTGLGEALLFWNGSDHAVVPGEGGHADFAPRDELETAFLHYLRDRDGGPVSWEHVLSGRGLTSLYAFLRDREPGRERPELAARMQQDDAAPVVCQAALDGSCGLCGEALQLFVSLYGAEAGNLALRTLCRGGLYVGGGIAARIAVKLAEGPFMRAFVAKDRMADLLAEVPVHVILDDTTALVGAARCARRRLAAVP
jgi:glucokinase